MRMGRQRPTLLSLCAHGVAANLLVHPPGLRALPWELADIVLADVLAHRPKHKGILAELQVFCEVFWTPQTISMSSVERVNCAGLFCLQLVKKWLHRLDLTGCGWLDSLYFLPGLSQLRCLNLRNCQRLPEDCLACIKALPQLECLDLENVGTITDAMAAYHIPGMPHLRALNVSGTGAANQLIEALTYGSRLRNWANEKTGIGGTCGVRDDSAQSSNSLHNIQGLLHQWPSSQLVFLRFQRTMVTKEAVAKLLALQNVFLIDVRSTSIPSRSLAPLAAKHGLTVLPESSKLLARSSGLMAATLRGVCGCCAVEGFQKPPPCTQGQTKGYHYAEWERAGVEVHSNLLRYEQYRKLWCEFYASKEQETEGCQRAMVNRMNRCPRHINILRLSYETLIFHFLYGEGHCLLHRTRELASNRRIGAGHVTSSTLYHFRNLNAAPTIDASEPRQRWDSQYVALLYEHDSLSCVPSQTPA